MAATATRSPSSRKTSIGRSGSTTVRSSLRASWSSPTRRSRRSRSSARCSRSGTSHRASRPRSSRRTCRRRRERCRSKLSVPASRVGRRSMITRLSHGRKLSGLLLASTAVAMCLVVGGDRAAARFGGGFGGFHGGGFGGGFGHSTFGGSTHWGEYSGGAPRFGDGGFFDRGGDAGFGRGGWGSVHNAGTLSDRADSFQQSHPEAAQSHPTVQQNASQIQQNRFNEADTLNRDRYAEARNLQYNRDNTWNNYSANWGGYYSGAGLGAGLAIGATFAALPAAAYALSV